MRQTKTVRLINIVSAAPECVPSPLTSYTFALDALDVLLVYADISIMTSFADYAVALLKHVIPIVRAGEYVFRSVPFATPYSPIIYRFMTISGSTVLFYDYFLTVSVLLCCASLTKSDFVHFRQLPDEVSL